MYWPGPERIDGPVIFSPGPIQEPSNALYIGALTLALIAIFIFLVKLSVRKEQAQMRTATTPETAKTGYGGTDIWSIYRLLQIPANITMTAILFVVPYMGYAEYSWLYIFPIAAISLFLNEVFNRPRFQRNLMMWEERPSVIIMALSTSYPMIYLLEAALFFLGVGIRYLVN